LDLRVINSKFNLLLSNPNITQSVETRGLTT